MDSDHSSSSAPPPKNAIADDNITPLLEMHYKNGDNELDLVAIYRNIKALDSHPGRGRLGFNYSADGQQIVVHQCSDDFIDSFWTACGHLLDYFADFLPTDTPQNKVIWFHMLDMLQEAARLPHSTFSHFPHCDHAGDFVADYEQTLEVMNQVIMGSTWEISEDVVHGNMGLTEPATFLTGPWKNGIHPWEQYLMRDSPGFSVPKEDRKYPEGIEAPKARQTKESESKTKIVERCVPSGALAIVQKHTDRARILAEYYAQSSDDIDEDGFLAEFDSNSVKLDQASKYTTLAGHSLTATPFYPSRNARTAPIRTEGWYDPNFLVTIPTFWMLDEAVANYKGSPPMVHPGGERWFWMMNVQETINGTEGNEDTSGMKNILADVWDNWAVEETLP